MKILLVEPAYRKKSAAMVRGDKDIPDDSLWYPPIGLMKISRYHKNRKDDVQFVAGECHTLCVVARTCADDSIFEGLRVDRTDLVICSSDLV